MPGTVAIKGNKGDNRINIKRIESWEVEMMLGIRTGLSGQDEIELAYKMEDATILVGRIKQDSLTYFESEIVYREIWMATIKYCLPFTRFTQGQCHKVSTIVEQTILPNLGFNRQMHKTVLYEPKNI